jgi:carbon starvation protein
VQGQTQPIALNGGAVVIGATAYLVLSVLMGLLLRFTKTPWYVGLIGSVVILALCIWQAPAMANWLSVHGMPFMNTEGKNAGDLTKSWDQALLVYCFIASITPMWLLLQPRGVIGATFLYAALAIGIIGAVAGGFNGTGELKVSWPAFKGFYNPSVGYLFPFLFITIACGACSGFHSIVASGTTSKQIRSEKDLRPVGYGSMLLESMVAVFSLASVMILIPQTNTLSKPDTIYALGIGRFASQVHPGIFFFAVSFGLLAFSSFVFDTLDVCTRLGRYVFQEITGLKGIAGGAIATLITLAGPSVYLASSPPGSFRTFWTIFGTSNQLLAALTLVGVSVWLWRTGRPVWFVLLPAIFMAITTGTALVFNFMKFLGEYRLIPANVSGAPSMANMIIAAVLFLLGSFVVFEALRVWKMSRTTRIEGLEPVMAGK